MNKHFLLIFFITLLVSCGGGSSDSGDTAPPPSDPPTVVTPVNSAPVGSLSISGIAQVGEVLTLSENLSDANGLGTFSYLWRRTLTGTTATIDNANTASYTLTSADIGFTISVTISYTDGDNFAELVNSNDTAPVTAIAVTDKPNILLIIADDQGVDASAQYAYSNDLPDTPTLNALAEQSIIFDNVWATPACTTTRGTLITGQHGINSGISYVPAAMDSKTQTLQRYLKSLPSSANYQTAVVGKWHLGGANPELSHPSDSGIDYYAGTISGTLTDYYNWQLSLNGTNTTSSEYHTSKITDLAIDWLALQNQTDTPWFMWLAYVAPHSPFHLPPAHLHQRDSLTGTEQDIATNKRAYYLAAIEAMDSEIGRLLDSLPANERENTLIVYIGDNGTPAAVIDTAVFDKGHSKGSLTEGGIRIPMFVSGKGVDRVNVREDALVNTTDFYATFANFTGSALTQLNDSYSFLTLLSQTSTAPRTYNYAEFESNDVTGWAVRNQDYKLIHYSDTNQELYNINDDINESTDLLLASNQSELITELVSELSNQGKLIRNEQTNSPIDITNMNFVNRSANCADYIESYHSTVFDVQNSTIFKGDLTISLVGNKCIFTTNNIPNHDFNDGDQAFPNNVSAQDNRFEISAEPTNTSSATDITLNTDNAILLNGVKVDLLAAACFGVGDGKVGCNDINQPWRYDPMFSANGFRVDSHNAHSQPDGSYHYHGKPNALFDDSDNSSASPVVGFAADGYPIFGSFIDDNGTIRKALSSFQVKTGTRPSGSGNPGGSYDGTYRDDYQYIEGSGDLDECNGMTKDGIYGYYITDGFPYILTCFKGTPDPSFNK